MANEKPIKVDMPFTELINRVGKTNAEDSAKIRFLQNTESKLAEMQKEAEGMQDDYDKFGKI